MKKFIPILLLALTCMACEKELDTYVGESGMYFDTKEMLVDTVSVHWGLKNSEITEQDIRLKVCLFGNTTGYDRKFQVEVMVDNEDELAAVEGTDYRPFTKEYVMPANLAEAYIDLKLLRRDDLETTPRRFTVRLIENEELRFLYSREQAVRIDENNVELRPIDYQRVVYMDESFPTPAWWGGYGVPIFGKWSAKKSALICDVMKIDRELFVKDLVYDLTLGYLRFAGKYMHRWLQENPQMDEDEDGNQIPMQMGVNSQN